jgi:hypothetical protein
MFKQIRSGLAKFFTKERMLIIFIFILFSWVLLSYSGSKSVSRKDGFTDVLRQGDYAGIPNSKKTQNFVQPASEQDLPNPAFLQNEQLFPAQFAESVNANGSHMLQDTASPSDLLPQDQNSQWSALNPNAMTQGNVMLPDLLQAGYHIGLDTIGQTLRNPNLQLRSDPMISKQDVGPWNLSTIEPDVGRVPLEIGDSNR